MDWRGTSAGWAALVVMTGLCAASGQAAPQVYESFEGASGSTPAQIGEKSRHFPRTSYTDINLVTNSTSAFKNKAAITLSAWVNVAEISEWGDSIVFLSGNTSAFGDAVTTTGEGIARAELIFNHGGTVESPIYTLSAVGRQTNTGNPADYVVNITSGFDTHWKDHWRHVAATFQYDTRQIKIFVDGQQMTGSSDRNPATEWAQGLLTANTDSRITVGTGHTDGTYPWNAFKGRIDDVSLYDTALANEHVRAIASLGHFSGEYNAPVVAALLASHGQAQDWTTGFTPWHYVAVLPAVLQTPDTTKWGKLAEHQGQLYLPLTETTGMVHAPEPAAAALALPLALLSRRRRKR